ncbi:MAG TPA: hypothetical protein VF861_00355 [Telluria sp.]
MFKKLTIAAALAVFATGCAMPIQGFLPPDSAVAQLKIRGELVDMADVKIFINGEKVIDDRLALLSGDGEFHGLYGGREVTANCSSKSGLVTEKTKCAVFVDRRRASTLSL